MLGFLVIAFALLVDRLVGEPRRGHPLVLFGGIADGLYRALERRGLAESRLAGSLTVVALTVVPAALALVAARVLPVDLWLFVEVLGLYLAVGLRSLEEHAVAVAEPLAAGDLAAARTALGWIVSRDTGSLDATAVAKGATESVLENGADAVFASLFWFLVAGLPGVVLHRLVNTLDAMWGYQNPRFRHFGWAAARLDDLLNYPPARLTAVTYALCGNLRQGLRCWRSQAPGWASPNAGPVMAAGAGALGVRLGGEASYHGAARQRPVLGAGAAPDAGAIRRAIGLVRRGVLVWLVLVLAGGMTWQLITAGG